jgi:hypothetical protein
VDVESLALDGACGKTREPKDAPRRRQNVALARFPPVRCARPKRRDLANFMKLIPASQGAILRKCPERRFPRQPPGADRMFRRLVVIVKYSFWTKAVRSPAWGALYWRRKITLRLERLQPHQRVETGRCVVTGMTDAAPLDPIEHDTCGRLRTFGTAGAARIALRTMSRAPAKICHLQGVSPLALTGQLRIWLIPKLPC